MKIMTFIGCYGHRRNATPWGSRVTKVSFETYEEANDWVEGQM